MLATLRYVFATFTVLVAVIYAISPFAGTFVEQWSRHDVELRSTLVFNSMRDELANLLAGGTAAPINNLFDRLAPDDWLLAAGFCDGDGSLRYHSKLMPANFSCERLHAPQVRPFPLSIQTDETSSSARSLLRLARPAAILYFCTI